MHQDAPDEETELETFGALEDRYVDWASGCKEQRTAEETDQRQWWVPSEIRHCPRTVDPPCHSCT